MTANSAQQLADRLAPGVHFIYQANTFHEGNGGSRFIGARMAIKSGKWAKDVDVIGEAGGFRMELPRAAKHVQWLDENTVRYSIVGRDGHTVTLRILDGAL